MNVAPLEFVIILFVVSISAGLLGSLVGLGGGVVIVPVLTLVFHIDIRLAIGASIVAVIATSSGAAASYVKDRMTNLRAGMFLEIATSTGAICGAFLTTYLPVRFLFILFACVLTYSGLAMYSKREEAELLTTSSDALANSFKLHGSYVDKASGELISYKVTNTKLGLLLMYIAGMISALLGIGSGALKVPAMDLAMHIPLKASSATSNFMIGVTAAASAGVYFARGDIDPILAAPIALGVLVGALVGSRLLGRLDSKYVKLLFIMAIAMVAVEMFAKGI